MVKENKKGGSISTDFKKDDFPVDKIASLWNQLRLAWINYHKEKNNGKETKSFEILIMNLLKELGIHADENQMAEIFKLSIDVIPTLNYSGKPNE